MKKYNMKDKYAYVSGFSNSLKQWGYTPGREYEQDWRLLLDNNIRIVKMLDGRIDSEDIKNKYGIYLHYPWYVFQINTEAYVTITDTNNII